MTDNKKNSIIKIIAVVLVFIAAFVTLLMLIPVDRKNTEIRKYGKDLYEYSLKDDRIRYMIDNSDDYPTYMFNIVGSLLNDDEDEKQEMIDFCYNYPFHKDDYINMQYTDEELNSKDVPALYMRDKRWAYETIGGDYIINDGCTPVAITMAYINITHSEDIDPVKIARMAEEMGAVTFPGGVTAHYVKDICESIGLSTVEYNYDESDGGEGKPSIELIKEMLDNGHVVLAGMFGETFGGHSIIIRGCSDDGVLYINDPADPKNTEKEWNFDDLCSEIYYLWDLSL
ncbi:MAG: C39 family peptidase [Oscillospiraceae bacterium]